MSTRRFELFDCVIDLETKEMFQITETDTGTSGTYYGMINLETHKYKFVAPDALVYYAKLDPEVTKILYDLEFNQTDERKMSNE